MLDVAHRTAYNEDHEAFRDTVRKVFAEHMEPFLDDHEADGLVPRAAWKALGEAGMLCPTVAEENGGLGLDFGFNCMLAEELAYLGSSPGFTLQNDITVNYFERLGSAEQKAKYLPGMVSGDIITAIAMIVRIRHRHQRSPRRRFIVTIAIVIHYHHLRHCHRHHRSLRRCHCQHRHHRRRHRCIAIAGN